MTKKFFLAALAASMVASCAGSPAVSETKPTAPVAASTSPYSVIELAVPPGDGDDRQMSMLLDVPQLKLASIILRRGTVLAEHSAPMPVIIQAVSGAGTVRMGEERVRLDAAHMLSLAPNTAHEVEPDPGTDLVLLVYHLRGASQ